jgi:hypothetical protein
MCLCSFKIDAVLRDLQNQDSARSSKAMYSGDCAPEWATAPIDSMMNAQSINIPKATGPLSGSSLDRLKRCAMLTDSGNTIVVGIFQSPLEQWSSRLSLNSLAKPQPGASPTWMMSPKDLP